ncbi:MAG TPA: hypothetical protein VMZ71_03800, partial [Gemmataceae bacterium]|nr:hypothetical protein [Gemmataceae bacterium]
LVVAIRDVAPFALTPVTAKLEVEAGKKVEVVVKCDRPTPDFKGSVAVLPLAFPNPVKMGTVTIAEGKGEATITLDVQANARPGEYTLAFAGQAQVPVLNAKGAKANTLVSLPSRPITLTVRAAKK